MLARQSTKKPAKPIRPRWLRPNFEQLEAREMMNIDFPADLLLGRTLSNYTTQSVVNQTVSVNYTVYNQREVDLTNVAVATTLQPGVALGTSSLPVAQNGQALSWNLGTIPAYGRASVVISVGLPTPYTTTLDGGATASATIDAGTSLADTPAAVLGTQAIAPELLAATPDANVNDPFVQEQAAKLRYNAQAIFDFLNDDVGYESYVGSLRGARGTLWSEAGNSLDEASLGVALYRASGIPARYAHGTLSDANAQALILTMFPEPTQIVGYLAPGTEVSDPANDPQLLDETRDHYWLQIDVGAGFQNADTSGLPGGGIGTAFTTIDNTFNEVADSLRHKVQMSLVAETYCEATAAFNGANGLTTATVLDKTWNAVDLVGKPVSVSQFVDENVQGGIAFSSRALTYTPYFVTGDTADQRGVKDDLVTGTSFQEHLTNFPLGSTILTGLTLNVDLATPGSGIEHLETMLVDRIGYAARQNSATATLSVGANGKPALTNFDVVTMFAAANESPNRDSIVLETTIREQQANLQQASAAGGALSVTALAECRSLCYNVSRAMGYRYLREMDINPRRLADMAVVKAYWDRTRIILAKLAQVPATPSAPAKTRVQMDLLHEFVRAIAAPGQATAQEFGFRYNFGLMAGAFERAVLESLGVASSRGEILSILSIIEAAKAQNISIIILMPQDRATLSSLIAAPSDVLARIDKALASGKTVFAPAAPVLFNGDNRMGWYEVDPQSGTTIDVLDTGEHLSLVEYAIETEEGLIELQSAAFLFGIFFGTITGYVTQVFSGVSSTVGVVGAIVDTLVFFGAAAGLVTTHPLGPFFLAGFNLGLALGAYWGTADPPAQGQYFAAPLRPTSNRSVRTVTLSATPGQTLAVIPASTSSATDQNTPLGIPFSVVADLAGDYTLTAIAPKGWAVSLADASVTVTPAPGTQSGSGAVRLVARSKADSSRVARAEIQVNVSSTAPSLSLEVPADPLFTVSHKAAELPTAYRAVIRNLGPADDNYAVQFSNVTPGWEVITSVADVTLAGGTTGIVGVYLRPTGPTLPAPGTPVGFTFTVTSTSNPALTKTVNVGFVMPSVAATYFFPDRLGLSIVPGSTGTQNLRVINAGNLAETVTLTASALPTGFTVTGLPKTVTVNPGQTVEFPYSVAVANTVALNTTAYLELSIDKLRTGALNAEILSLPIRVVVPGAEAIGNAAASAGTLGKTDLADRLTTLTIALSDLVPNPTNSIAKSQSVAALDAILRVVNADPVLAFNFSNLLTFARNQLDAATTTAEVQSALDTLASVFTSLSQTLTELVEHGFKFSLANNVVTALPGVPARFPIVLENTGTEATTFDFSIASGLPFGMSANFTQSTITLQPGERVDGGPGDPVLELTFTGNSLFPTNVVVAATPQEAPGLMQRATGAVAVRPEFLQVAAVLASPEFVAPGNIVGFTARILNVVNNERPVLVSYVVTDPNGVPVANSTPQATTLGVQTALIDVALPNFDTTGLPVGDYTITVNVTDASGTPMAGGTGQTTLLVGTPVSASIMVAPQAVPAGSSTVTNTLQLDARTAMPNPLSLVGQAATTPTATTLFVNGTLAYVAGTNGIDIVDISNPTVPSVVGTFGQADIVAGNFTVARSMPGDKIVVATSAVINAGSFNVLTYSIANPTAPVLLGTSTVNEAFITDFFVFGNRALATTNGITAAGGFIFGQFGDVIGLDLTDPNAVAVTAELFGDATDDFNQNAGELVNATTLYVASTTSTGFDTQVGKGIVRVLDVSNPASIVPVTQLTIPGTVQVVEIAIEGNRALVVGSTGGWKTPFLGAGDAQLTGRMTLTLLDITDPLNPIVIGNTLVTESLNQPIDTADGGARQFALDLGNGNGEFVVSRGHVGGNPVLLLVKTANDALAVAAIEVPALVNEMAVIGGRLHTTSQAGLLIYDVGAIPTTLVTASVVVPNVASNHVHAGSFNVAPDQVIPGADSDTLVWVRPLAFGASFSTITWQTDVTGMTPGESREVTLGTNVAFVQGATPGVFDLPPTSIVGQNAVALSPVSQTVAPGATAEYLIEVVNDSDEFRGFFPSLTGVPTSWVQLPFAIFVGPHGTATDTLRITPDPTAPNGPLDFTLFLSNTIGNFSGTAQGNLMVAGTPVPVDPIAHGIVVAITPATAIAGQGTSAAYVVRLTNTGSETEIFDLTSALPPGVNGVFESTQVTVPAGTSNFREITVVLTADVGTAPATYPFGVTAASTTSNATSTAASEVQVVENGVSLGLNATTGLPGDTFMLTVTNTGTVADTFALTLGGPAAVVASLGTNSVTLNPGQSQVVTVTTGPITNAVPGSRELVFAARSTSVPAVVAAVAAELQIAEFSGMDVQLDHTQETVSAPGTAEFVVQVENTGNTEDAYMATIMGTNGPINAMLIGLNGLPTQAIQVFRLPGLSRGAVRLQAALAAAGQGDVTVQVQSLSDARRTANVTATVDAPADANHAPQANPNEYQVNEDTSLDVPVNLGTLVNDTDADLDTLQMRVVQQPAHGTLTPNADGSFRYVPEANFNGTDTFQYVANDGEVDSAATTVTITVRAVDDPLVLQGRTFLVPGMASETITVRFDWLFRKARFNNEVSILCVDDAAGRVGTLKPGDAAYLKTAVTQGRWQRVFRSGQGAGAVTNLTLRGGERFVVYIVQNGRTEDAVAPRRQNRRRPPQVFFMPKAANLDRFDHVRITQKTKAFMLAWEDATGGGDRDFNDVVLAIRTIAQPLVP